MIAHVPRYRASYVLIALNLVLTGALVWTLLIVAGIRTDLQQTRDDARAGCRRGNAVRDTQHYIVVTLSGIVSFVQQASTNPEIQAKFATVLPELERRAALPEIQPQPCDILYPQ